MNISEIKKLENLLSLDPEKKITKQKITRLTEPGENYGSLMLSVVATIESSNGSEDVHMVAKMVPPSEIMQKMFKVSITFPNEIGFYNNIVPLLQNFQREHGVQKVIDFFPKYLGSRLTLDSVKNEVDSDGVLLLENLKTNNFITLDRIQGVDFDVAKLILTDLAHLHGVALALRLQKPEHFKNEVAPYLMPNSRRSEHKDLIEKFTNMLMDRFEELRPFKDKVLRIFDQGIGSGPTREPFITIVHNDCWVNNNMIKYENGKPIKNKLVDYQGCIYGSPAKDVVFFLFSSVKSEVLEHRYDDLVLWYHQTFISVLEQLHCDVTSFNFGCFEEELAFEAKNSEFGHVIMMLFPIFAVKEDVSDISELHPEDFLKQKPTDLHKKRMKFVVDEFIKRNWI